MAKKTKKAAPKKKKSAAKRPAAKAAPKKKIAAAPRPAVRSAPAARTSASPKFTVSTAIEITATFPDSMGLTAKVAAAVAAENVNILAGTGYSASGLRRKATFTLIVDNLEKAERALERIGADEIQDSMVLFVETENRVGALEKMARAIANAGINIYYFYSTTSSGKTATCVFKTADDQKAIRVLRSA
ncbi:MAG: hypothetical protein AABZ15_12025 [Nitrospirota bacterium]